jgi:hypothetical protein
MALRLRRGTDAERQTIVPLQGELIYVTDTKKLYIGDGATQGGVLVGPVEVESNIVDDTTPQLGGNLDLNGNNIVGTGNIDINGTISATGNIGLGDADADTITVAGLINSSLRPTSDNTYDLGTPSRRWKDIYATGGSIDGQISLQNIDLNGDIIGNNSTVIYNASTDTLTVESIVAQSIQGNLVGSVFSDSSGVVLVDGTNSVLSNGTITFSGENIINLSNSEINIFASDVFIKRYGITDSVSNMVYNTLQGYRGTIAAPLPVQTGDLLGSFTVDGYEGDLDGNTAAKIVITGTIDTATGTNPLPGKMLFTVHDFDGNYSTFGSLNSRGVFENPIFKATPFANTTARDLAIPTPEAGMVIFNENDDLPGNAKLQCYNGTTWVDLH